MNTYPGEDRTRFYAALSQEALQQERQGLTSLQAEQRREKYGNNNTGKLSEAKWPHQLARAFVNPFSVVLFVLAGISLAVDVFLAKPGERNYTTVLIISLMLLVSGLIRLHQELRARRAADCLIRLVDAPVSVRRDGKWTKCEASCLVVGDYVRLAAGERVPADLRLTELRSCFFSESGITGESAVLEKTADPELPVPSELRDCRNLAFSGSTVVCGSCEGIVTAVGDHTLYGGLTPVSRDRRQGFDRGSNAIAWVLIRFMAVLVPVVFIASGLTKGSWFSAFLFALSVAVGLTPELLPMVITACLARGSFAMSRKQTVVKNINAMQGFGSMDVICVDKTGTLTEDGLLLEYYMDILGNEDRQVLDLAYLNSVHHSGIYNPLDQAILKTEQMPGRADRCQQLFRQYEKLDELPFDYGRKISSVLLRGENGGLIVSKGDPESILARCSSVFYGGKREKIEGSARESLHAVIDEMLEEGMKVLAVAVRTLPAGEKLEEQNMTLMGYLGFLDPPKDTAADAIGKLRVLHVHTKVLTGDCVQVARSVCRRLGMDSAACLTGRELEQLSDNDVQIRVEHTQVFAELSPTQKARIVSVLRSNGHTVGFLADGMNDLPAVLQADVGISVDTAVPAVKECADVLLMKKDLNILESGITEGRRAFANMKKYVKITASSNLGNITAIVAASILLPFFPMTSIQLLLLNLLYDILCLVLPWDHVDPEMYARPMEWSGRNLSRFMLVFGPVSSVFDLVTFAFLFFFLCPGVCGGAFGSLGEMGQAQFIALFQTGWFLESMWTQVLILHLLRTERLPFLQSNSSRPVWTVTCSGTALFTLLAVTPAGRVIGMTAMPPIYYLFLVLTVACYLLVVTWVKQIYVRHCRSLL